MTVASAAKLGKRSRVAAIDIGSNSIRMIVADKKVTLVLTGTGDVLEPERGLIGIGSGGNYALAAARALFDSALDAEAIVRRALDIAAEICVYTNRNLTIETLKTAQPGAS